VASEIWRKAIVHEHLAEIHQRVAKELRSLNERWENASAEERKALERKWAEVENTGWAEVNRVADALVEP
jgi:hypothetical protein